VHLDVIKIMGNWTNEQKQNMFQSKIDILIKHIHLKIGEPLYKWSLVFIYLCTLLYVVLIMKIM
jgi:hypothetical protein